MLNILLIIIASIFFLGIVNRVRSTLSGRKGPGLVQSWLDIYRLTKKQAIYSKVSSFMFQIAPSIQFASIICAILVVPFGNHEAILAFDGDFIFFAYVLAVGKFFMICAALDTGSPFEGMGANREALYSMLAEPAFFVLMGSFAMLTGHFSFHEIFNNIHFGSFESFLLGGLATYLLVQIAMVENSRLPVDDPKTHLELTMVHEVMILDTSGIDLAMIATATTLKFAIYGMLITNFFLDPTWSEWLKIPIFFTIQAGWAITVALLESFRARARMKRNPLIIFSLTALSILIFFGVLIIMNKFML